MRVRVTLHGWLKVGVDNPDGLIELTLPDETDVAGVIEALRETLSMLDPRSCLVMVGSARVPLDRALKHRVDEGIETKDERRKTNAFQVREARGMATGSGLN